MRAKADCLILTTLLLDQYLITVASIIPRQENVWSPILDPAINAVGKWVVGPVIDGVVTGVGAIKDTAVNGLDAINDKTNTLDSPNSNLFQDPSTHPSTEEQGQPRYRLGIQQNQGKIETTTNRVPTQIHECDSTTNLNNENSADCEKTNPVVVFPTACASPRNGEITTLLTEWVSTSDFWISHSRTCGGILFWSVARLNDDQIQQLRAMTDMISSVEPDGKVWPHGKVQTQESLNANTVTKRNLQKRDDISIQRDAKPDLAYISNPEGSNKDQPDYYYLTNAGEGITIYLIEQGVEEVPEFTTNSVIQRWLFAGDAKRTNSDDSISGHGTCVGSKVSGLRYGPIKRGTIINVKMSSASIYDDHHKRRLEYVPFTSLVDAMQQVVNDLQDRTDRGDEVRGFTVVNLSYGMGDGGNLPRILKTQIRTLINQYQVVFVTSAGNVEDSPYNQITDLPAILSPGYDIIVVGSIDIRNDDLHPESCRGPQMTITAPGDVICSSKMGTDRKATGTSVAAGTVSGVIAGFMSSAWGKKIRESGQAMPKAAKNYIVKKGLKRNWDRSGTWSRKTVSVWNGLNPDLDPPLYGWTPI